ncbi:MAG: VOC family protein, partial [Lachnospiraceae bacterium]|nr:VOC family protein [Lachnospiraceae bacterium]
RDFFVNYFGGKSNDGYHNPNTDFRSFFITFDDGARLEIMKKPVMDELDKPLNRTGYIHLAFSVGSKEAVDELTARLKSDGYEVVSGPRTTGDGYYESCIVGIEGNQIEITV